MALPDFVVVGAPDAGTRILHTALARHPGLAMSEPAEPGFFLAPGERPPHPGGAEPDVPVWCRADYEALFPNSGPRPRGESTPGSTAGTFRSAPAADRPPNPPAEPTR